MKNWKVGEMWFGSDHFVIYCKEGSVNPYRILRKWWDGKWRTKQEAAYADMSSVTAWLHQFAIDKGV